MANTPLQSGEVRLKVVIPPPGKERIQITVDPITHESELRETKPDGTILPPLKGRPGAPERG